MTRRMANSAMRALVSSPLPPPLVIAPNTSPTFDRAGPSDCTALWVLCACAKTLHPAAPMVRRLRSRAATIQEWIVMISPEPSAGTISATYHSDAIQPMVCASSHPSAAANHVIPTR